MCFALQDPVAWNDMASFDLSETTTPPRHNQAGYTTLLQEKTLDTSMGYTVNTSTAVSGRDKNCASFGVGSIASLTPISSSKPSQASNGRRRRRERGEPSPLCDRTCSSFLENISNSPKKTPTKSLPFTPSRVNKMSFFLFTYHNLVICDCCVLWLTLTLCGSFPQFCNISGVEHLNLDNPALTSTPVCSQRCLLYTPLHKETTPKHQKENDG